MTTVDDAHEIQPLGRNRNFLLLWFGAGVSYLGSRVSSAAYTLLVYWSTGSATAAGLVGFAALLPQLIVQLPAGVLVDRVNRRRAMIAADIGRILAIGSVVLMVVLNVVVVPVLMAVAFVEASLTIVYLLAERAAVFAVVPGEQIGTAMSRNEARSQASGLIGQPAGTMAYALERWAPFAVTMVAHLTSLVTLLFVRKDLDPGDGGQRRDMLGDAKEGLAFVRSQHYLQRALTLIAASNILFQVLSLGLIVMVKQAGGSPFEIGVILAASGVGGVLGSLSGGFFLRRIGIRWIIMGVNIAWAVLMGSIVFTQAPVALAVIYTLLLFGAGVSNVAGVVYTMRTTPGRMQGRVGSIVNLLSSGGNAIGALGAGLLFDSLGTGRVMIMVGVVMAGLAVLSLCWFTGRKAVRYEADLDL